MGAGINIKATGTVLRKSGTLVLTKILVAWGVALVASLFLPDGGIQSGLFAGFSVLALIAAMDMTNGGLYASIMQQYGSKEEAGAFVLMSLESGPLVTMLILGSTGLAAFHPQAFVGAVLPFLVGFALGNLDPELRDFFSKATHTMIPFFGFALGNSIDLTVIAKTGMAGIILGLLVIVVTGIPLMLADKFIAEMKPEFLPVAQSATALVAASVIVTSILVPILTAYWSKYMQKKNKGTVVQKPSKATAS
jgi:2-keto-3-deoxygluconate permease